MKRGHIRIQGRRRISVFISIYCFFVFLLRKRQRVAVARNTDWNLERYQAPTGKSMALTETRAQKKGRVSYVSEYFSLRFVAPSMRFVIVSDFSSLRYVFRERPLTRLAHYLSQWYTFMFASCFFCNIGKIGVNCCPCNLKMTPEATPANTFNKNTKQKTKQQSYKKSNAYVISSKATQHVRT